jgi:cell division protein FtsX
MVSWCLQQNTWKQSSMLKPPTPWVLCYRGHNHALLDACDGLLQQPWANAFCIMTFSLGLILLLCGYTLYLTWPDSSSVHSLFPLTLALNTLLLLTMASLILYSVRMSIWQKKQDIHLSQLLGASPIYITGPFLYHGIIVGFLSACLALFLLSPFFFMRSFFTPLLNHYPLPWILLTVLCGGWIIGALSAVGAIIQDLRPC